MNASNAQHKVFAFLGADFVLLSALNFTACRNATGCSGDEWLEYTPTAYTAVNNYLKSLPDSPTIREIEVTGLPFAEL